MIVVVVVVVVGAATAVHYMRAATAMYYTALHYTALHCTAQVICHVVVVRLLSGCVLCDGFLVAPCGRLCDSRQSVSQS